MKIPVLIISIFISSIILFSCKKETIKNNIVIHDTVIVPQVVADSYYIKATVNGTNIICNFATSAVRAGDDVVYLFANDTTDNFFGMTIEYLDNPAGIVTLGVYTDTASQFIATRGVYNPYIVRLNYTHHNWNYTTVSTNDTATGSTPFICNVTTINDSVILGTFSGRVYLFDSVENITNGSFYLSFTNSH